MTVQPVETPRRARARRGEGDKLRDEIMEAAEALLVERGDQDLVSMRAIAERVGCTAPALYLHFADKDELFADICDRRFVDLYRALAEAAEGVGDDPYETLRRQGHAYVAWALEHEHHYRFIMMSRLHLTRTRDLEDLEGMKGMRRIMYTVARCIETGAFAPADPFKVTVGLWTALHGLVTAIMTFDDFPFPPAEEMTDHLITTHIAGLRP